jgi:replicative DNA helicase
MSDPGVSLDVAFKTAEIIAVVGSAAAVFYKLGRTSERFEQIGINQAVEISSIKTTLEKLSSLVTEVALQKQELSGIRSQQNLINQQIEGLRRGDGYIVARKSVSP